MKKLVFIVIIGITISFFIVIKNLDFSSSNQGAVVLSAQITANNGQIIDVREPDEYLSGHADGAINVPLGDILNGDFSKIDINKPVYVYCRSGIRAGQAKVALEKAGYKDVTNLGGLSNWEAKGNIVCKSSSPSCQ